MMRGPMGPPADGEARLIFTDSSYQVATPGRWVRCAVTGQRIALEELRYWSARRQEAYVDAMAATKAMGAPQT